MHLNKNTTGLVLGSLLGLVHLLWALLVLFGWAQGLMDWIFSLHFITPPYMITVFGWGNALLLIIVTAVIGYVLGWVFAWLWNKLHKV